MSEQKSSGLPTKAESGNTIVERITESIRQSIRDGSYQEGQRIVVADLSQQFGVSYGPVREAIRRLAGEGILTFTAHKGASVRRYSEKEIREFGQAREAIEGYIARLAAENIHRSDYRERLQACLEELRAFISCGSPEKSSAVRQEFHDVLYEIAGNDILAEEGRRFTHSVMRVRVNRLLGESRERDSLKEHELIVEAILAGESVRAERLMRAHIYNGVRAVCDVMARDNDGVLGSG